MSRDVRCPRVLLAMVLIAVAGCSPEAAVDSSSIATAGTAAVTTTAPTTTVPSTTSSTTTTTTLPRLEPQKLVYGMETAYGLRYGMSTTFAVRTEATPDEVPAGSGLEDSDYTGEAEGEVSFLWNARNAGEGRFEVLRTTALDSIHLQGSLAGTDIDMTLSGSEVGRFAFVVVPVTLTVDALGRVLNQVGFWGDLQTLSAPGPFSEGSMPAWIGPPFPSSPVGEGDAWSATVDLGFPVDDGEAALTQVEAKVTGQEVYDGTPVFLIGVTYHTDAFQFSYRDLLDLLAGASPEQLAALGLDPADVEQAATDLASTGTEITLNFDASNARSTLRFDPVAGVVVTRTDTGTEVVTMNLTSPQGDAQVLMEVETTQELTLLAAMSHAEPAAPGEPPVAVVDIRSGSLHPANLEIDPAVWTTVRWQNSDGDRTYTLVGRDDEFESTPIPPGGTWELDVSELEPGVHHYYVLTGQARAPGTITILPAD